MTRILETDESGSLRLPAETLGHPRPRSRYIVEADGVTLVVRPEANEQGQFPSSKFQQRSPEERVKAFLEWVNMPRPPVPHIPLEALRRENLYQDRI